MAALLKQIMELQEEGVLGTGDSEAMCDRVLDLEAAVDEYELEVS